LAWLIDVKKNERIYSIYLFIAPYNNKVKCQKTLVLYAQKLSLKQEEHQYRVITAYLQHAASAARRTCWMFQRPNA